MDKPPNFNFGTMNLDFKNFNFTNGQGNPTPSEVVSITEVVEEKAFLTWKIEGVSDDTKWEAIKAQAKCFLELGKNTAQPTKLCFFLREDGSCVGSPGFFCKTVNDYEHDIVLRVKIEKLNVDGSSAVILNPAAKTLKKETGGAGNALCCILTGAETQNTGLFPVRSPPNNANRRVIGVSPPQPPTKLLVDQDFIRIGISLSMYICKGSQEIQPAAQKLALESLTKDLGNLYNDGNGKVFFHDLELETKDGVRLKTHKFIVAARSPPLKTRLEEQEKEAGNGISVLKMPELNAQPLRAILHWMYTGELSPLGSLVMGDVIKGARSLQLTPLMRICDKKLISICTTENMFDLYQVAKDNAFPNASKDISLFIKANI